ncbi:MAG: RNA polymerase sigma factor [Bacteroidia bacterium]|nr:RNA polymerase sigma factor [Bacteroidia bacterium]
MGKVCHGQIDKLGILFERYHVKLFNFFLRTTADRELSHDLTQSVFERILKYRHSYKNGSPFKAWFYQIARNVKIDYFRKQKIKLSSVDDLKGDRNPHLASEGGQEIERDEKIKILYESLNQLPADKREILVLSQLEELEYKEIAKIFEITENAARVKVHRALKALKEVFHKKY